MPIKNPFDNLRIVAGDEKKSITWYRNQVKSLFNTYIPPSSLMADTSNLKSRLVPGELYLYNYDPKYKDTLPYYDTFPLVYPYQLIPGGFMGYNLHYIPPTLRIRLMGLLMDVTQSENRDTKKILRAYNVLNAAQSNKYLSVCIKKYLNQHVRSRFLLIPQDAWISAAVLPIEKFVKQGKQSVWADSLSRV